MEGIGLAVDGAYPPLTQVIARYIPRWLAFTLIFAIVGAAGANWYHVNHPIRIAALVGLLGWFIAHFDVTFDATTSAQEHAKYTRIAKSVRSRFRKHAQPEEGTDGFPRSSLTTLPTTTRLVFTQSRT